MLYPKEEQRALSRLATPNIVEVRSVPSEKYQTLASALVTPPTGGPRSPVPRSSVVVIQLQAGQYEEPLCITTSVVIVGADGSMPTIRAFGSEGIKVSGTGAALVVLRKLRLVAGQMGPALIVHEASPLVEDCEIVGSGGKAARGSPPGVSVRGAYARPVLRGCLISGHAGAGVSFTGGACGLVSACEVSMCGCGIWLESGADPVIWKNMVTAHQGAGIVVRADARGCMMGNTIIQNGAGGILVESSRRSSTVIVQNRVWANKGCDLRQSPSSEGKLAAEVGAIILSNSVGSRSGGGQVGTNSGPASPPSAELSPAWPRHQVRSARELEDALHFAPRDRVTLIEMVESVELTKPLVLDRPVVLAGTSTSLAEVRGAPGTQAAVLIGPGAEAAALMHLAVRLPMSADAGTSCVVVVAGRPLFVDCELDASGLGHKTQTDFAGSNGTADGRGHALLTHALRATGSGSAPVLYGCTLRGASGAGMVLEHGASATVMQCEVSGHKQGGIFLGSGATTRMEASVLCRNGHFGVVVGPGTGSVYMGRSHFSENAAGSVWHCGGPSNTAAGELNMMPKPVLLLDQCSLAGAGEVAALSSTPGVVVGPIATAVLWDSFLVKPHSRDPPVRAEASACAIVAGTGPVPGHSAWSDTGTTFLDASGTALSASLQDLSAGRARDQKNGWKWGDARIAGHGQGPPPLPPPKHRQARKPPPPPKRESQRQDGQLQPPGTHGSTATGQDGQDLQPDAEHSPSTDGLQVEEEMPAITKQNSSRRPTKDVLPQAVAHPAATIQLVSWLQQTMQESPTGGGAHVSSTQGRRTMYELLSMQVVRDKNTEALDTVGLGGTIRPGDTVFLRGHTGLWIGLKGGAEIVCNKQSRDDAHPFIIETKVSALRHGSKVAFSLGEIPAPSGAGTWTPNLGVTATSDVRAMQRGSTPGCRIVDTQFFVQAGGPTTIASGMPVYLKSASYARTVDVEGEKVRARSNDQGTLQRLIIEKLPDPSDVPAACGDYELRLEQKAWLYYQGVQLAIVDKLFLAQFLTGHKEGREELLKAYTKLWEADWRQAWSDTLRPMSGDESGGGSPASTQSRGNSPESMRSGSQKRARSRTSRFWGIFSGSSPDKNNADMFVSAMRSFFATALRVSKLEANPIQRVIETFAQALVEDSSFLECFSESMLPEKDRTTYKTADEVLFGVTYTTMMLNTDMHSNQVGKKMFDAKKFEGVGKDCGVTPGFMGQIFKNIEKEQL